MRRLRLDKQVQKVISEGYLIKSDGSGEFQNFAPGTEGQSLSVTAAGDLEYKAPINIGGDSVGMLTFNATTRELNVTNLNITTVTTSAEADIAGVVLNEYPLGTEYQEGDMIIIPADGTSWIHNGGVAGTVADFTKLTVPGTTDSAIRALFTGINGVEYNSTTGEFKGVVDPDAANDITLSAAGFMLDVSQAGVIDTNNLVAGSTGGTTEVTLQDLLDVLSLDALPAGLIGDIIYHNGTNWVKATPTREQFTPIDLATTATLAGAPIASLDIVGYSNGFLEGDISGSIAGTTWTLPFTANGVDEFEITYYV